MARVIYCQNVSNKGSATLENPNRSVLKKKCSAALLRPFIESASGQNTDEKDDKKPAKKNLGNVPDEKHSNAKGLGKIQLWKQLLKNFTIQINKKNVAL